LISFAYEDSMSGYETLGLNIPTEDEIKIFKSNSVKGNQQSAFSALMT